MVTKWSLFVKKITVAHHVKEQNHSLIMIFHQLDITLEFPAEVCFCDLNFANVSENDSVPNTLALHC